MEATYSVTVHGSLPLSVVDVLRHRFERVEVVAGRSRTVIECCCDQPALRSLLTLVWDVGSDVLLLTVVPTRTTEEEMS